MLDALFRPSGLAFVGATPDPQRYGGRVVQYCMREEFPGGVYAVNPKYASVFDVPCYPNLASVPGPVDVVVVLVGPNQVPSLLDECKAKGVRYAIALGDLVAPGDPDTAAKLAAIRRQIAAGAPRIVGPVCVGLVSPHANLAVTMSSGMLAGRVPRGGIGLITQSGGVMSSVLDRAHQFGAGFSALVSSGAEFDLDLCDYVEYLVGDPATRCIAIYAEKLLDPQRLFELAARAREARKPILMLKSGVSPVGAQAMLTHSGAIAGDREIEDAALRRCGIVRVRDLDDLHMSAELLCRAANGPEGGVAAVSQSGGYCSIVADTLEGAGVPIAVPASATLQRIMDQSPVLYAGNPHDSASGPPGNNAPHTRTALLAFRDDPAVGVTLYAETMYMYQDEGHILQKDVVAHGRKPHLVCWQGGRATEPVIQSLRREGVLTFDSLAATASALSALYRYRRLVAQSAEPVQSPGPLPAAARKLPRAGGLLDDEQTKALLRAFDIPLVPEQLVARIEDAVAAAERIGFPVVVKGRSAGVAHKSELGLVAVALDSAQAVRSACSAMALKHKDQALQGYLVQPMVAGGVEFVVGVKTDKAMGPAVILGLGGLFVEAYGAPVIEMAPVSARIAGSMIAALDKKGILDGYRTGRPLAKARLAATLQAVGRMAWALRDRIDSVDLNPVIVTAQDAYAVDAVCSLREPESKTQKQESA